MNFRSIVEAFGPKKLRDNQHEELRESGEGIDVASMGKVEKANLQEAQEAELFAWLDKLREEFDEEEWEDGSEKDDFMQSIDEYEDEYGTATDPELMRGYVDLENTASGDDDYAQFDNLTDAEIFSGKKGLPSQKLDAALEKTKNQRIANQEKQQLPYVTAQFKRMKEAKEYSVFKESEDKINKIELRRGDKILTIDEIKQEIAKFEANKQEEVSDQEKTFIEQCRSLVWARERLEANKVKVPVVYEPRKGEMYPELVPLTEKEIRDFAKQYDVIKNNEPENFALMEESLFEFTGNQKVEQGLWFKQEFAWEPETHKGKNRWACRKDDTIYVSNENPGRVAPNGVPAEFFYTVTGSVNLSNNTKVMFLSLKMPQLKKQESKPETKNKAKSAKKVQA